jgi:hypothetical protein
MACPSCHVPLKYNHNPEKLKRGSKRLLIYSGIGVVFALKVLGFELPTLANLIIGVLPIVWAIGEMFHFYHIKLADWPRYAVRQESHIPKERSYPRS